MLATNLDGYTSAGSVLYCRSLVNFKLGFDFKEGHNAQPNRNIRISLQREYRLGGLKFYLEETRILYNSHGSRNNNPKETYQGGC
jgi:hypothetical protein